MDFTNKIKDENNQNREILEFLIKNLSKKRLEHIQGVEEVAVALSRIYNVSEEKTRTAALFHDMYKGLSLEEANSLVIKFNLDKDRYYNNINLAHSKLAAYAMEHFYNIKDQDVINAVKYHTTGRSNMSSLEKIIFVADAIEKNRKYQGVESLRILAKESLDDATIEILENTLKFLKMKDITPDGDTQEALKYLKENFNE